MSTRQTCGKCIDGSCRLNMDRRRFLKASGAAALAMQLQVFDFASTLLADEKPKQHDGPLVSVGFALRESGGRWWPAGTTEMLKGIRAQYEKILTDAAGELGVRLDIMPDLMKYGSAYMERIKKTSPDGQILMALDFDRWKPVYEVLKNRGKIPTIIYANLSFHRNNRAELRRYAGEPGIYLGATADVNWLKYALRMHRTLWRVKHKPVRILTCPGKGYDDAFKQVVESDKMRTIADFYRKTATKVVEPPEADVLKAVKHYMTIHRLIRDGGYDGVTLKSSSKLCLGGGWGCLALSRLLDEGIPAACENDITAAQSQFLTMSLFDLPGLMGNPTADTVNNWFIVSHCTSATRLEGLYKDYRAPFLLRDFHNTGSGVAPMVAWPKDRRATVMMGANRIGAGHVRANTDDMAQPPSGGCRTSVAFALDGVTDALQLPIAGHPWCVLADIVRPYSAYCKLAGIELSDLEGSRIAMSSQFGHRDWGDGVVVV